MQTPGDGDLGFSFKTTRGETVTISRSGRPVTVLRGASARRFLAKAQDASIPAQQQLMARVTGNYKRGNEHHANDGSRSNRTNDG